MEDGSNLSSTVSDKQPTNKNLNKVIQFIDVSGRMLYDEAKAEKSFVTMMQASVSHELRNPLASLIFMLSELKRLLRKR